MHLVTMSRLLDFLKQLLLERSFSTEIELPLTPNLPYAVRQVNPDTIISLFDVKYLEPSLCMDPSNPSIALANFTGYSQPSFNRISKKIDLPNKTVKISENSRRRREMKTLVEIEIL